MTNYSKYKRHLKQEWNISKIAAGVDRVVKLGHLAHKSGAKWVKLAACQAAYQNK